MTPMVLPVWSKAVWGLPLVFLTASNQDDLSSEETSLIAVEVPPNAPETVAISADTGVNEIEPTTQVKTEVRLPETLALHQEDEAFVDDADRRAYAFIKKIMDSFCPAAF